MSSYATGGWESAESEFRSQSSSGVDFGARLELLRIIDGGLHDWLDLAEQNSLLYASTRHAALAFALLDGFEETVYPSTPDWLPPLRSEAWTRLADSYRSLPIGLDPSPEASRHAAAAEAHLANGNPAALDEYEAAVALAPWWPEGHYNLALVDGVLGGGPCEIRELQRYLDLAPNGGFARQARTRLSAAESELRRSIGAGATVVEGSCVIKPPIGEEGRR